MADCSQCKQASGILRIFKCVVCFKPVCERCAVGRYGQKFCTQDCANSFLLDENGEIGTQS